MKRNLGALIFILFVLSMVFTSGCRTSDQNELPMGNTNANISNAGISVLHEDWIFFMNYADSNKLYKVKTDGTGETKVSDDYAYYLNSYGDWIYYSNAMENGKLYKMKPDGTERTLISDASTRNVVVYKDWIYYSDLTDPQKTDAYTKIFRMKMDGSGNEKVTDFKTAAFNISEDWIYYINPDEQKLYRVKIDGSNHTKLIDSRVTFFNVLKGDLYYFDSSEEKNNIWKMRVDGTEAVKLSEDKASTFNVSGDWIYYGNTQLDSPGLELKKMKLDGSEASVISDDDAIIINVHGDWIVCLGMDFTDFSVKQTILKSDGTERKDFLFKQTPQAANVDKFPMQEKVKVGDLSIVINSVYSTNIVENKEIGADTQIYDDVTDGKYIYINMTLTNDSDKDIDLTHMTGFIEDINAMGLTVYWGPLVDMTNELGKGDIRFHFLQEAYHESMQIKPNETKDIQAYYTLSNITFPIYLGMFNGTTTDPLAAFEVTPSEEDYVVSWNSSLEIMKGKFPGDEITQLNGMGFKFEGEEKEMMYYTFEVTKPGTAEPDYYLVKRDTAEIFVGVFDEKHPDYKAVPLKPME